MQKETWAFTLEKANRVLTFIEITEQTVLQRWPPAMLVFKTPMNNQIHGKFRLTFSDNFFPSIFNTWKSQKDNGQRKTKKKSQWIRTWKKSEVSLEQLRTRQHSGDTSKLWDRVQILTSPIPSLTECPLGLSFLVYKVKKSIFPLHKAGEQNDT